VDGKAIATDNVRVTEVRFYMNGQLKCTDRTAPWGCGFNLPSTRGSHTMMVQASDAAGNVGRKSVTVWVN